MNRLKKLMVAFSLILAFTPQGFAERTSGNFDFTIKNADVLKWRDGDGQVLDSKGEMAQELDELLASATRTVDMALYGVNHQQWMLDRIVAMQKKGVRVRMVVDQVRGKLNEWIPENFTYPDTASLVSLLKPGNILPDVNPPTGSNPNEVRAGSIMHNKFIVIDQKVVWVGTANVSHTEVGGDYNANTVLTIRSPEIARLYANEFQQMFKDRFFSVYKRARGNRSPVTYRDGTEVSIFFSPQDNPLQAAVLPFIHAAKKTLDIGMFFLTERWIADALIEAVGRGVEVRLIYDASAAAHPTTLHNIMREGGVQVKVENWGGKMHMKAAVADGKNVLIGSMNWSQAGSRTNDENVLVIKRNSELALELSRYFSGLWAAVPQTRPWAARDTGTPPPAINRDPRAEGFESINSCFDGLDNDHDMQVDVADSACKN